VLSPLVLLLVLGVLPDSDSDGDVDGIDFSAFSSCYNMAGNPPRTFGCPNPEIFDNDLDGDIDGVDFSHFASCFNGAGRDPASVCFPPRISFETPWQDDSIDQQTPWFRDFLIPDSGRISVGVVYRISEDENDKVNISVGHISQSLLLDDSNIFGPGNSDYSETGVTADAAAFENNLVRITVTPTLGTPTIRGVIVRGPDPVSGIVQNYGSHCYSEPASCVFNGHEYRGHLELYTGSLFLSKDGEPLGKISDGSGFDYNDYLHYDCFVVPMLDGICVGHWGHNIPRPRIFYFPDADLGHPVSRMHLAGGVNGDFTYCRAVVLKNEPHAEELLILTRGERDNSDYRPATLMRIDDVTGMSPTISHDVVFDGGGGERRNPIAFQRLETPSGQELAMAAWAFKHDASGQFLGMGAAVFDPSANAGIGKWFNVAKVEAANNSALGTRSNPRFSDIQRSHKVIDSPSGVKLTTPSIGSKDHHFPDGAALFDVSAWDNVGASVLGVFTTSSNGQHAFEPKELEWVLQLGSSRWLSGFGAEDFVPPALTNPNHDRVSWACRWKDDNPSTGIAYALYTNRGTRVVNGNYDANTLTLPNPPNSVQPFFDWGSGDMMTLVKIINPMDVATIQFLTIDEQPVINGFTDGFPKMVFGDSNKFTYDSGVNELNQKHRQAESMSFIIADD
jgi:hypothetical protein